MVEKIENGEKGYKRFKVDYKGSIEEWMEMDKEIEDVDKVKVKDILEGKKKM